MDLSRNKPHFFVPKGWGWESWIVNNPEYCGKALFFKQGKKCSFHYHKEKSETFYCYQGRIKVWLSDTDDFPDNSIVLEPGDSVDVPRGTRHQMEGLLDSILIEFSTEHKDSDSYRIIKGD